MSLQNPAKRKSGPRFPADPDGFTLDFLADAGFDLSNVLPVEFLVYVPDKTRALALASRIDARFGVTTTPGALGHRWLVRATREMIPAYKNLHSARIYFERIAVEADGEYDGWGALA